MTMDDQPPNQSREGPTSQKELPTQLLRPDDSPIAVPKAASVTDSASTLKTLKVGSTGPAKVAIPRSRSGIAPRYGRRVPRACESCRSRKTKCSGDTPVCRQCRELRISCQYPVGWKEKTKRFVVSLFFRMRTMNLDSLVLACILVTDTFLIYRQVESLSEKAVDYENLLKDLGMLVETKTADRIRSLLDKVCHLRTWRESTRIAHYI
jgi:hypothetical protein